MRAPVGIEHCAASRTCGAFELVQRSASCPTRSPTSLRYSLLHTLRDDHRSPPRTHSRSRLATSLRPHSWPPAYAPTRTQAVPANPLYDCREVSSRPRFAYPKTSYRLLSSLVVATSVFGPASLRAPLFSPPRRNDHRLLASSRTGPSSRAPSSPVDHGASTVTSQKDGS